MKALRKLAAKLGVSAEYLERGADETTTDALYAEAVEFLAGAAEKGDITSDSNTPPAPEQGEDVPPPPQFLDVSDETLLQFRVVPSLAEAFDPDWHTTGFDEFAAIQIMLILELGQGCRKKPAFPFHGVSRFVRQLIA